MCIYAICIYLYISCIHYVYNLCKCGTTSNVYICDVCICIYHIYIMYTHTQTHTQTHTYIHTYKQTNICSWRRWFAAKAQQMKTWSRSSPRTINNAQAMPQDHQPSKTWFRSSPRTINLLREERRLRIRQETATF